MEAKESIYVEDFDYNEDEDDKIPSERTEIEDKDLVKTVKNVISKFVISKDIFIKQKIADINEYYELSPERIGEGAFGVVYLGIDKETREKRAIKRIDKVKILNFRRFMNEVYALKTLDHPNIIKLFEIYEDEDSIYLVQELWTGGELFDYIYENTKL